MAREGYNDKIKKEILERVTGPEKESVAKVALEYKITRGTIYNWLKAAEISESGDLKSTNKKFTANMKFHMVLETSSMSEEELGEYCRRKGIYTQDIKRWAEQCVKAIDSNKEDSDQLKVELRGEREKNKKVERELRIKEKALAEAAALLILRKNVHAIWGDKEEE